MILLETVIIIGSITTAVYIYKAVKLCKSIHVQSNRNIIAIPPPPVSQLPQPRRQRRPRAARPRDRTRTDDQPLITKVERGVDFTVSNISEVVDAECSICLENFEIGDELKNLKCSHSFHINCIEDWFQREITCPVCRDRN